jgi:hypothetical protein
MAKDLWIAVPTYWTYPAGESGEETTVFDHPTPLDDAGTLARTLESFTRLEGEFKVLVVAAGAHASLGERVHDRVAELLRPFAEELELYLASPKHLDALNAALPDPILKLDSYGNIRNVQLIVPYALGADAVIGIDDDEIIEDADFLAKVESQIGRERHDGVVGGMAGPYYDANGKWEIAGAEELESEPNIFIKKNFFMNRAIGRSMNEAESDGLVKSNVAFGGNMTMARHTISRACHDPYITRGEDYDYVVNAAMAGIFFYFQPAMSIVHLPPDSTGAQAADKQSKLVADIYRFIYMQEKMRQHAEKFPEESFDREYLMPYPGPYLDPELDLQAAAVAALDGKYPDFRTTRAPEELAAEAASLARVKAEEFFAYRERWCTVLAALESGDGFSKLCEGSRLEA